ncbi:MAG: HEAT repeat domain-containing protein [Planctomycetota bacterium]
MVEHLIERLHNGDDADRLAAAQTLASLGTEAAPAAVALARYASDPPISEWCVAALEELGPPAPQDVAALAELLETQAGEAAADSVYWAATLLGRLGPPAGGAVPQLTRAAEAGPALPCRERAAWALGKIGPVAAGALPTLETLAAADQSRLARLAQQAIEAIKP